MYFTYSEQNRSFENLGVWTSSMVSVSRLSDPQQVLSIAVSPGNLEALGVAPELGRWFSADDQKPGAVPTILLKSSTFSRVVHPSQTRQSLHSPASERIR
jgi:hypothetical protein